MESSAMIYLTSENYRRLDVICRQTIGRPLAVYDVAELQKQYPGRDFAHGNVGIFKGIVDRVPSADGYKTVDMGFIPYIANYIDIDQQSEIGRSRPWIDHKQIPETLQYDFLVYHETAHVLYNHAGFMSYLILEGKKSPADLEMVAMMAEYQADSYAWSKIFPGKEMPQRLDIGLSSATITAAVNNLQKMIRTHSANLQRMALRDIKPISLDPDEYVPVVHAGGVAPTFEIERIPETKSGRFIRAIKHSISRDSARLKSLFGKLWVRTSGRG